jgi:hypothetical protein
VIPFASILGALKSPVLWACVGAAAVIIFVAVVYREGETKGGSQVEATVERTTNAEVEKARKEQRDAEQKVRDSSPDAVVDSTR